MDKYNVVWQSPSKNSSGSMPLGNGDIGLNVWIEENGDLVFYIGKTDAWDEDCRLVKLGRIRVKTDPSLCRKGQPFVQTLKLRQGEIDVVSGDMRARVWVDANAPVVRIGFEGKKAFKIEASVELWRDKDREIANRELFSARGVAEGGFPIVIKPDTVFHPTADRIAWCHRNESSVWPFTLKHQGMEDWISKDKDPLMHRTYGGVMRGEGMVAANERTLASSQPRTHFELSISVLTSQTDTPEKWLDQATAISEHAGKHKIDQAYASHLKWWDQFWNRSWIRISCPEPVEPTGPDGAVMDVSHGYVLQRYITACAGRGAFPIKFNGSLFTVDHSMPEEPYDADYRRWGGCYWFQNTRLPYWPMLASGDFEMMEPLFRMYMSVMPMAIDRTRIYFNHQGVFFPETMFFWGSYANNDYGWDRKGLHVSEVVNTYIKRHWEGGLELAAIILDRYNYAPDRKFLSSTLLPFVDGIITFCDQHYKRDADGKVFLEPAQSLETWPEVINPLPDIAGLHWLLDELLKLPAEQITEKQRSDWARLKNELPPLPSETEDGKKRLLAAQKILEKSQNCENPELYCVFPFRIYGVGKPDIDIARNTFAKRINKTDFGWQQDEVQAAFLGLTEEAKTTLTSRFSKKHEGSRFPAFWGPNYDWIPDQDHGTIGVTALQTMLMQCDNGKILLLPAWPKDWDVDFKLHAPSNTVVEGVYRGGKMESLKVTPKARENDVVICGAVDQKQ